MCDWKQASRADLRAGSAGGGSFSVDLNGKEEELWKSWEKVLKNRIKLIRSFVSEKTGSVRFTEDMLVVNDGSTPEKTIKDFIESK